MKKYFTCGFGVAAAYGRGGPSSRVQLSGHAPSILEARSGLYRLHGRSGLPRLRECSLGPGCLRRLRPLLPSLLLLAASHDELPPWLARLLRLRLPPPAEPLLLRVGRRGASRVVSPPLPHCGGGLLALVRHWDERSVCCMTSGCCASHFVDALSLGAAARPLLGGCPLLSELPWVGSAHPRWSVSGEEKERQRAHGAAGVTPWYSPLHRLPGSVRSSTRS
jgi:hypothetical protein